MPNSLSLQNIASNFFYSFINSINDPLFVKNRQYKYVFGNTAFCQLINVPQQTLIGKTDFELVDKNLAELFNTQDNSVFTTGNVCTYIEEFKNGNDGQAMYYETKKNLFEDENGNSFIIGIVRNVTELKKYKLELEHLVNQKTEEIRLQHQYIRNIIDLIPNVIGSKDKQGRFKLANKALKAVYNVENLDIIGKKDKDFNPDIEKTQQFEKEDELVFETGQNLMVETQHINKTNGQKLWYSTTKSPLFDENGNVKELVLVATDITKRMEAEQKLKQKNEELQQYINSNLQLENFAYIASHDLKAPIRTISSFGKLLKKSAYEKLDIDEQEFLDYIIKSSKNLTQLISDLLEFSKASRDSYNFAVISPTKIILDVFKDLRQLIYETDAQVILGDMPEEIIADPSRFKQIIQNLISNGIKFQKANSEPIINITSYEMEDYWQFLVKDNGIGIEHDHIKRIFLLFKRLHSTNEYEGTGLGLSICKTIAEHHKGTITVESIINEGSTFSFTIAKNIQTTTNET